LLEEAKVIALVRTGEVDAFAGIIEHYQAPVIRYLYRMTGDYETAKDLAQDTFVQAYKGILKTTAELSFRAWLYRIATNTALQYRRRRRLLSFIPFTQKTQDIPAAGSRADCPEETAAIQEALLRVPREQRTCLVLHLVEGFKYREIADTIGCTEEAVRKRVARGKKTFMRLYGGGEDR